MGVVLAPANGTGAAASLIRSGAREVYWGFFDAAWTERFGAWEFLNRMSPFGPEANSLDFDGLLAEVSACRALEAATLTSGAGAPDSPSAGAALGASSSPSSPSSASLGSPNSPTAPEAATPDTPPLALWCTFNSPHYTPAQIDWISKRYLPALAAAGATGIIVSGPRLIAAARDAGLEATASTMCAAYNADIVRFFRDEGATRVILPRDLTLDEIASITSTVPDIEYEAFLMRNGCLFADSHCLGLHRAGCPSLCRSLREGRWSEVDDTTTAPAGPVAPAHIAERLESGATYRERFHECACGQCAIWQLEEAGIRAYKVVGRGDDIADLEADVALTAANIAVAGRCSSQGEYHAKMSRPDWLQSACADEGLSCYYPEVRPAHL